MCVILFCYIIIMNMFYTYLSDELLSLRKENKLSQERIRDQYDKEFNNLACSSEHTQLVP